MPDLDNYIVFSNGNKAFIDPENDTLEVINKEGVKIKIPFSELTQALYEIATILDLHFKITDKEPI